MWRRAAAAQESAPPHVTSAPEIVESKEFGAVKSVKAEFAVPSVLSGSFFLKDDVRYKFDLGGGATMDMGVYALSAVRYFSSSEPEEILSASAVGHPLDAKRIDRSMHAVYRMSGDVSAETYVDFSMPGRGPFGVFPRFFKTTAFIELEGGKIELNNFPIPHLWHTITIRPTSGPMKTEKVYKFESLGEDWWTTYRYQLEAFVAKVRGGQPQTWPSASEPLLQMTSVEKIYDKVRPLCSYASFRFSYGHSHAGMPNRPPSSYRTA
ncbi:hypothetical protein PUNSTDRAFT_143763 [Punctularia strigosozonata HHB-11173 SS5]|uniref:uncharacterized protein n=1 Tax=Punctularia strigosozonata (strain HHB-11173) TaxID=741275 RepID=UPI0004416CEC|nr:uncharacterized protein PUNSTDRAFT_143763 [Punctularia strigosozonata HHB-11173 SS5]EIN09242.1 hypothetical protein PUNSTDRAFT_143763 [Punctularia strigosozonata HHB-11173 SS5]